MQAQTEAERHRAKTQRIFDERTLLGKTTATVERIMHAGPDALEHTKAGVQRIVEPPLDRLHKQGFIVRAEFEAGDRYRADAYLAAIDPAADSVDWNAAGGGGRSAKVPAVFSTQVIADARIRFRDIESRISGAVRIVARLALVKETPFAELGASVFGYRDKKDAEVAGRVATRMACAALVDGYRL